MSIPATNARTNPAKLLGWRAGICRLGMVLGLLGIIPLTQAVDDRHWTTNGIHSGIIADSEVWSFDFRSFTGSCQLSYSLWSLVGEPVQDFIFYWHWPEEFFWTTMRVGEATVDGNRVMVRVGDLTKHPDLLERFQQIKPADIELNLNIQFLTATRDRIALGKKTVKPDFIGQSGEKLDSLSPGSPNWADFFDLREPGDYLGDRDFRAKHNQEIFRQAKWVELSFAYPAISKIEWPEWKVQNILKEYGQRESKSKPTNQVIKATNDIAGLLTNALNPFEQAALAAAKPQISGPLNPFEQAVMANQSTRSSQILADQGENPFETASRLEAERLARIAQAAAEASSRARLEEEAAAKANTTLSDEQKQAVDRQIEAGRRVLASKIVPEEEVVPSTEPSAEPSSETVEKTTPNSPSRKSGPGITLQRSRYYDSVEIKCETCQGSGHCATCGGKGGEARRCSVCQGTKQTIKASPYGPGAIMETCPYCAGIGAEWKNCLSCRGTAKCFQCKGRGKIKTIVGNEKRNNNKP